MHVGTIVATLRSMATDERYWGFRVPQGSGWALDLGGGPGKLRGRVQRAGYRYVNLDIAQLDISVQGDAHALPFQTDTFSLILSADSLEHFPEPAIALGEVRRTLRPNGIFLAWVPFLHPFHTN